MTTRKLALVAAVLALTAPTAAAAEVATIVNESDTNVELFLKWSDVPFESQRIVLAPGEVRREQRPPGTQLYVRFDSTPGVPGAAREVRGRVITANVPGGEGYVSTFRRVSPAVVALTGR